MSVKAKKHLGQHFLKDPAIARTIVEALERRKDYSMVIEVGPGMGILTDHLFALKDQNVHIVELDKESVAFLQKRYPDALQRIIEADFLQLDLHAICKDQFAIIGNFPYNISTQILFKVLEYRNQIPAI